MDFPHTHGSTIFISQPFIEMITKYYNNNDLTQMYS